MKPFTHFLKLVFFFFFFSRYIRLLSAPRLRFSLSFFLSVLGIASSLSSPRLFRISRSEERTSSGLLLPKWRLSWGQRCNFFSFSVCLYCQKKGVVSKKRFHIYIHNTCRLDVTCLFHTLSIACVLAVIEGNQNPRGGLLVLIDSQIHG